MIARRIVLILCAAAVVGAVVTAWEPDPFVQGALVIGALFVGLILVAGWRQLDREARDVRQIARSREAREEDGD